MKRMARVKSFRRLKHQHDAELPVSSRGAQQLPSWWAASLDCRLCIASPALLFWYHRSPQSMDLLLSSCGQENSRPCTQSEPIHLSEEYHSQQFLFPQEPFWLLFPGEQRQMKRHLTMPPTIHHILNNFVNNYKTIPDRTLRRRKMKRR